MEQVIDVRLLPPAQRHPAIFAAWDALPVGGVLRLVNDHDPKPLSFAFRAEKAGEFEWKALERGPEVWSVAIKRLTPAKAPGAAGPITLEQTVKEVADRYPAAAAVLARHGLDLCCGGVHPIALAAQAHGVDAQELLAELNAAAAAAAAPARPGWASEPADFEVDVREDLRAGREPFAKIIAAAFKPKKGQTLLLRAPFEPKPLYKVLGLKGFEHHAERAGEDWNVFFRKAK